MGSAEHGRRAGDWRDTWLTRRALGLHLTLVVVVPGFIALFWWQVQRVRQGNSLSWAYVFEWPFFTGYAVYLWWRLVHEQPTPTDRLGSRPPGATNGKGATAAAPGGDAPRPPGGEDEGQDEELAAYNRYLAELAERDAEEDRR